VSSLYAKFLEEYESTNIIETEKGFCTYKFIGEDECYIENVYVLPEYRREDIATKFGHKIEVIAKENGCKYVTGSVCLKSNNPDRSNKFMLNYGFILDSIIGNMIYYKKEI